MQQIVRAINQYATKPVLASRTKNHIIMAIMLPNLGVTEVLRIVLGRRGNDRIAFVSREMDGVVAIGDVLYLTIVVRVIGLQQIVPGVHHIKLPVFGNRAP